jgi:hypothetical protein
MSWRSSMRAVSSDTSVSVTGRSGSKPASAVASTPPQARAGAALSSGSRTRSVCTVVFSKPSASTARTRSSATPAAVGSSRSRPEASGVSAVQSARPSAAPRACTSSSAMALKPWARTVASTCCPGSTGVDGVMLTSTPGALAARSATTRSVKPRVTLLRPSLTVASTRWSATWPGPGVHSSRPLAAS